MPSFLLAAIVATSVQSADNISVLGNKPRWDVLERYQQTITHDEFLHLINDVYCTHGFAADLIDVNDDPARILMSRQAQEFVMGDCLLVTFENIPPRLVPKDADIARRLNTRCNDRRQ